MHIKRIRYPEFYKVLITEAVAQKLELDKNLPILEIVEIKKNKSFIAKEAKTFNEEKKISSKAPVENIQISNISKQKSQKNIKTSERIYILLGSFYSIDTAKFLKQRITKDVPEFNINKVETGQEVLISLITGEVIKGNLTFVSKSASTSTRTFKVESQIQNKDGMVRDGITAEMIIKTKFVKAHKISPSILILNDNGKIGVRSGIDGVVVFHNVSILEDSESGLWITDIPDSLDLIVQGQGFVEDGQQVVTNQI